MNQNIRTLVVEENTNPVRIDRYLATAINDLSRTELSKLLDSGNITIKGAPVKKSYKVKPGQEISVILIQKPQKEDVAPKPTEIPLNIVYEDDALAVINKESGLTVHKGETEDNNITLVSALLFRYGEKGLSKGENPDRPGIVHRLDKDTSGLITICKTDEAHIKMKENFQQRTNMSKIYHTIVVGKLKETKGVINKNIMRHPKIHHKMVTTNNPSEGKDAITEYEVSKVWKLKTSYYSLIEINLKTGRTHQIRVHMSSLSTPIVGDPLYHKKNSKHNVDKLCLVAKKLSFPHPTTGEKINLEVDYPDHIKNFIEYLNNNATPVEIEDDVDMEGFY